MPVSANIFQQYLQAPKSVNDYRAEMDMAEARQNALAIAAMEAKARQQAMQDEEAYRGAVSASGGDQNALIKALNSQGLGTRAQAVQKSMLDAQKIQSGIDVDKSTAAKNIQGTEGNAYELRIKKHDQAIKDIAGFSTPEQAVANLQAHIQSGDVDATRGQAMLQSIPKDPAEFARWQLSMLKNIMSARERLAFEVPDANTVANNSTSIINNQTTNQRTAADNAAARGVQVRGQNITAQGQVLTDARARERMDFDKAGGVSAAGGANAKLTESEGKNTLYLSQMRDASNTLDTLGKASPAMVAATGSPYTNWMAGKNAQKVGQTQRQWAEAYLRAKTGAAATQGEVDNNIRTFFPVLGDDEETIKQKMGARRQAENDMEIPAGRGAERAVKRGGSATANRPALTDIFK